MVTNLVNEYNMARHVVKRNQVEYWVNGIMVTEYEIDGDKWKVNIMTSTYANNVDFGKKGEGEIAFFSKNENIWVRNVRIKKL